ncbi:MAG TPA: hypothetical protein VHB79_33455 [Polyangiaceae bacterium]|nr:hypothetical protein [Polyangiaceae bacterium]
MGNPCGKTDDLRGIKENVIMGRLIPAGTGLPAYKKLNVVIDEKSPTYAPTRLRARPRPRAPRPRPALTQTLHAGARPRATLFGVIVIVSVYAAFGGLGDRGS